MTGGGLFGVRAPFWFVRIRIFRILLASIFDRAGACLIFGLGGVWDLVLGSGGFSESGFIGLKDFQDSSGERS